MPNRILSNAALFRVVVFISFAWLVSACGGGGGGSRTPDDTTPTAFSFAAQSDVALETEVTSAEVTILGINTETPVSITGGEVSINGGSFGTTGSINVDQTIEVRLTSSSDFETSTEATIDIGGVTATFSVTTFEQDIEPEAFTFEAITDVEISSEQTSEVTITDINDAAAISIVDGEYSIDGGDFTDEAGTVENDSTVVVRLNASAEFSTETELTLSVGDVSAVFSVETEVLDITPEAFVFAAVADITPSEVTASAPITVTSINAPAAISVVNGEFSINGADFIAAPATVTNGQTVIVRATAPATPQTELDVALTIGDVSGTFNITTLTDDTPPTALIAFPPPASMTEGTTVFIRGTAEDDFSAITGVSVVNGETSVAATDTSEEGDFSSWEATVTLAEGENTLTVEATDSSGNTPSDAPFVSVRQDSTFGDFPNSENGFQRPAGLVYDSLRNQLIVGSTDAVVLTIDVSSGQRLIIADNSMPGPALDRPTGGIVLSSDSSKAWISDTVGEFIFTLDLSTGSREIFLSEDDLAPLEAPTDMINGPANSNLLVFASARNGVNSVNTVTLEQSIISSNNETPGLVPSDSSVNPFSIIESIAYDEANSRYLVPDGEFFSIFAVDELDGSRTVFANNTFPNDNDPLFDLPLGIVIDSANNRALFIDEVFNNLIAVDLTSNERVLISGPSFPSLDNDLNGPSDMVLNDAFEYVFVTSRSFGNGGAVFAVDLVSGHRMVLSKAESDR